MRFQRFEGTQNRQNTSYTAHLAHITERAFVRRKRDLNIKHSSCVHFPQKNLQKKILWPRLKLVLVLIKKSGLGIDLEKLELINSNHRNTRKIRKSAFFFAKVHLKKTFLRIY